MILTRLGGLHDGVRGPRLFLTKDLGGLGQRARLIACLDIAEDVDVGREFDRICLVNRLGETLGLGEGELLLSRLSHIIGLCFGGIGDWRSVWF